MNNACPTCGAVYAVTQRDIGRKLRCKKCSTALAVSDAGLVVDTPSASAPPLPAASAAGDDFSTPDEDISPKSKKSGRGKYPGPGAANLLSNIGGIPTILFAFGTFLVIWFTFMTPIGEAASARAQAGVLKIEFERQAELKKALPKGKKEFELEGDDKKNYEEKKKKINDDYDKRSETAKEDADSTVISNARSVWFDKYGQLFGFVFLAFGSIGYLRTEQPLVMKIVAAVVLGLMLLMIFNLAVGGCNPTTRQPIMTK